MAGEEEEMPQSPFGPLLAEVARMRRGNLNAAIQDVDSIIDLLTAARDQVAGGTGNFVYLPSSSPFKATLPSIIFQLDGAQDEANG